MPLIKSHSNYVLKNKHQLVEDGTIFERDITTIGAVNQFATGQTPIYRSGNFIITVRDDRSGMNQYNTQKWEKGADGDSWTLSTIDKMVSQDETQDDTKIVLKNDYYDFREFAYYGSLTELFRSSVSDILERFPGELYCVSGNGETGAIYYTSSYTEDFETITESVRLGGNGFYEVSNPFGINIHSAEAPKDVDPLKYFANGGYKNYTIGSTASTSSAAVTTWKSVYYYSVPYSAKTTDGKEQYIRCTGTTINGSNPQIASASTPTTKYYPCKGDKVAEVTLNNEDDKKIYAYLGDNDLVYYLHKGQNGRYIRPTSDIITDFYNGCNDLQRIMLNQDTSPKYKATFSVLGGDDFGYTRKLEEFIYPTSEGGYNPSADGEYLNRLIEIGEFYDENLTDNLYRSMTHEAIKNFDWTYTREYNEGDEEEFIHGGEKIQKALRLFAREFDEQKKYIDNIKNTGRLTYDERGNIPDYFLADICEDDGWDVKSVIPYDLSGMTSYNTSRILRNTAGKHAYYQSSNPVVTPYSSRFINDKSGNGYFIQCSTGGTRLTGCLGSWYGNSVRAANQGEYYDIMFPSQRIEYRIKSYTDEEDKFTYMDVNNEFLRRLKLNSRQILRHKGTIEGIEMILGMFGLKSKRWVDKNGSCRYKNYKGNSCGSNGDYNIIEYTQFTSPITDTWDSTHDMYKIDWINSTKTITYDHRSTSNYTKPGSMGASYSPYQGLPVVYRDISSSTRRLYPNFNKNEQLDGNPYFQMDGGWLAKTINGQQNFQFDVDDNVVHSPVVVGSVSGGFVLDNHKLYKETIRTIKRVENLSGLLSLPQSELYDGIICYVARVDDEVAVINGEVFPVEYDNGKKFVRFTRYGGFIKVGDLYFDDSIVVLGSNLTNETYSIDDKLDGYEVRAFINGTTFVCKSATSEQYAVSSFSLINASNDSSTYSNYFKLDDTVFSDIITYEVNSDGWRRLKYNDSDYFKINTIHNYYKGNNGHNGNMKYDSGHEYFTYFQRLFKYAEDNSLFDTRCYREGYDDLFDRLHPGGVPIGFSNLINSNEAVTDYDSYLSTDTKVHYFGNYKDKSNKTTCKTIHIYGDNTSLSNVDEWKKFYGNDRTITPYSIGSGIRINGEVEPHTSSDSVTNQIVNNKRLKIIFNMKYSFDSKNGQIELKYIDDIVMNYLTQMIPSTVITEIEYNFCDFNNTEC